ncbi:MAG: ATP-binding cassette domain-containing protein [Alphaproteobacteria bacterium]|nr:ATP-binding cassette domain-containing protein [Rickettsiales bacterium]
MLDKLLKKLVYRNKQPQNAKHNCDILLELSNFSMSIHDCCLVSNLNFKVKKGDIIALLGKNGSGKTTLLRTIAGLNEHNNYTGNIILKSKIAYMPQVANIADNIPITVGEFIELQTQHSDKKALDLLRITPIINKQLKNVSGGQTQKVLFYNAINSGCDIVLLDEPENHLDNISVNIIIDLIKSNTDKVFIVASHEYQKIVNCSNHVLEINKSLIVCKQHNNNLNCLE